MDKRFQRTTEWNREVTRQTQEIFSGTLGTQMKFVAHNSKVESTFVGAINQRRVKQVSPQVLEFVLCFLKSVKQRSLCGPIIESSCKPFHAKDNQPREIWSETLSLPG